MFRLTTATIERQARETDDRRGNDRPGPGVVDSVPGMRPGRPAMNLLLASGYLLLLSASALCLANLERCYHPYRGC